MAICSNENCRRVLLGGYKDNGFSFCNKLCHKEGYIVVVSNEISQEKVIEQAKKIHEGECPKCKSKRPVDIYLSYRVFSFLLSVRWTYSNICCHSCGIKAQIGDLLFSLILGWFGILGIIYTPAYVLGNLIELMKRVDQSKPSLKLENYVKKEIAAQLYNKRILKQVSQEEQNDFRKPDEKFLIRRPRTPRGLEKHELINKNLSSEKNSMKNIIFKISLFFKGGGVWFRFVLFVILSSIAGFSAIPDLLFNLEYDHPVELTINNLKAMAKEKIPKYIKIKGGSVLNKSYVEYRDKDGKGELKYIYYPVYNLLSKDNEEAFLVIKDSYVKEEELKNESYFSSGSFKIEGKFDDSPIDTDANNIFKKTNYKISEKALMIEKGEEPISTRICIIIISIAIIINFFILLSLLPTNFLTQILNIQI